MAFDHIKRSAIAPGKTVQLVLNMLPGSPVVHVEHVGETNVGFMNELLAKANGRHLATSSSSLSAKDRDDARARNRETLARHSIRHLEATHSDGTPATDTDIPDFVAALPDDVVDLIRDFVRDPNNFRERPIEGDPKAIAEK